jgi:pimeloyl-ACP methyl ester carboxylesterase
MHYAQTTSGMASVDGATLYYEIKGEGRPLILISGGGILDRRGWDDQFETFAKHYRVIRYDVRGLGKSTRPTGPFSHSQDLFALLNFLRIKRAHILGLSVGGAIAIDFTLDHPHMVDRLVLAASGVSDDSKGEANMEGLVALTAMTKKEGLERVIQLTLDAPFVISKENAAAREKIRVIYLENRDVFESGFPVYSLWQPTQPPASQRLSDIDVDTLIIRGDKDHPAYTTLTEKASHGIRRARTVVIPGGTHFINLERPNEFNQLVFDFLRDSEKQN